jgi:hypothetical protein
VRPAEADAAPDADAPRPALLVCLPDPRHAPPAALLRWAVAHGIPVLSDPRALAAYAALPTGLGVPVPL